MNLKNWLVDALAKTGLTGKRKSANVIIPPPPKGPDSLTNEELKTIRETAETLLTETLNMTLEDIDIQVLDREIKIRARVSGELSDEKRESLRLFQRGFAANVRIMLVNHGHCMAGTTIMVNVVYEEHVA